MQIFQYILTFRLCQRISKIVSSIEATQLNVCPNCQSSDFSFWASSNDKDFQKTENVFSYDSCKNCEAVFLNPQVSAQSIGQFYPSSYVPHHQPQVRKVVKKIRPQDLLRWPLVKKTLYEIGTTASANNKRVFLDYGCGSAAHLDLMHSLDWQTIGADFSTKTIENIRFLGHRGILTLEDPQLNAIEDQSVDCILLNHVFEHIYTPDDLLAVFMKKLKPGATMYFVLPNPAGISASLFGANWYGLEAPRHIILHNPTQLTKKLSAYGFSVQKLHFESITKDFSRSIGYQLKSWGFFEKRESQFFMNSRLLNFLAIPFTFLAAKLGRGDRFHVIVKKL